MKTEIINYVRAGYPGIYLVSAEEVRVEAQIQSVAQTVERTLYAWSVTEGLVNTTDGTIQEASDPVTGITAVAELPENSIVLFRDFHQFLDQPDPILIRAVKDALRHAKAKGKTLVILGCRSVVPSELEHEIVMVQFALPDKEELGVVLDNIANSAELPKPESESRQLLLDSACGLTSIEAENAFALSIVESGTFSPTLVARQKAAEVKKNGLLEVCPSPGSLDDIGGLELLKAWLRQRKEAFGQNAADYRLPSPKGLLIIGIPGTGKSLTAKATASVLRRPLLKLDPGRLFGGLVGQSESNLRSVLATVEAIAPCVLWIDEIEKGFAGSRTSGSSDGGTSSRVFGTFLSWLQERSEPVFVVATANDVNQLPPELLRKGRFDEIFSVDLPNQTEREAILRIQIARYHRDPDAFDILSLASQTDGLTGSEIEQLFIDSLYEAFSHHTEPTDLTVVGQMQNLVPLSKLMKEQIAKLRSWAKGRARPATKPTPHTAPRRIVANN